MQERTYEDQFYRHAHSARSGVNRDSHKYSLLSHVELESYPSRTQAETRPSFLTVDYGISIESRRIPQHHVPLKSNLKILGITIYYLTRLS